MELIKEKQKYDYTIVNNSGYTVNLIPYYYNGPKDLNHKITLNNGQSINKKLDVYPPYNDNLHFISFFDNFAGVTGVEITFNNTRRLIYHSSDCPNAQCSDLRSVFHIVNSNDLIEIYTITANDYTNAAHCGGNCN